MYCICVNANKLFGKWAIQWGQEILCSTHLPLTKWGISLFHKLELIYGYGKVFFSLLPMLHQRPWLGRSKAQYDPQHTLGHCWKTATHTLSSNHNHNSWKQAARTQPWHLFLQPLPRCSSEGLPLGRTGGLRTKGLVDKLVSTMAAVTLSMSSSSEDFLKHSEWEAGNTSANI